MAPHISTVIFDVDDTLYDQIYPFKQALIDIFNHPFTTAEIEQLYLLSRKYSDDVFEDEQSGKITTEDLQVYRITQSMKDIGHHISKADALMFQARYLYYQNHIHLMPEVEALLNFLAEKQVTLGILTNGNKEHQQMKITQLGIDRWIPKKHQFISGALPFQKPDQAVFKYIEDTLNLNKDTTYYVGDAYINDVLGARSADFHVVWFNHRNRAPEGDVLPDYTASTPEALLQYFKANID